MINVISQSSSALNLLQNPNIVIPAMAGINTLQIKVHGFRLKTYRNDAVLQVLPLTTRLPEKDE